MPLVASQFGVCGSDVGSGGVQLVYTTDVDFPGCQQPFLTIVLVPNSSALLDFSQPANSQYIPLMIP